METILYFQLIVCGFKSRWAESSCNKSETIEFFSGRLTIERNNCKWCDGVMVLNVKIGRISRIARQCAICQFPCFRVPNDANEFFLLWQISKLFSQNFSMLYYWKLPDSINKLSKSWQKKKRKRNVKCAKLLVMEWNEKLQMTTLHNFLLFSSSTRRRSKLTRLKSAIK